MHEIENADVGRWEGEGGNGHSRGSSDPTRGGSTTEIARQARALAASVAAVKSSEDTDTLKRLLEAQMVTITLLMRLYDVALAQLQLAPASYITGKNGQELADAIFDQHDSGGLFNPRMFVPELRETDTDEDK